MPSLYWGISECEDSQIPLFYSRSSAASYFGVDEQGISGFIDADNLCPRLYPGVNSSVNNVFVQRILFDLLHPLAAPAFNRGLRKAREASCLVFFFEEETNDPLVSIIGAEIEIIDNPTRDRSSQLIVDGVLVPLSIFETFASRRAIDAEAAKFPQVDYEFITGGYQAGVGTDVATLRRYWKRIFGVGEDVLLRKTPDLRHRS